MKPLHSIEALETRSGIADAPACLTRRPPASQREFRPHSFRVSRRGRTLPAKTA